MSGAVASHVDAALDALMPGGTECPESNDDYLHACAMPFSLMAVAGIINPSGDEDWYKLTLGAPQTLTVRLYGIPDDADFDLFTYSGNPPTSPIATSITPGNADETITVTLPSGVSFFLVSPFYGTGSYGLMCVGCPGHQVYLPAILR